MILDAWNLQRFNPRTPASAVSHARAAVGDGGYAGLCARAVANHYGWGFSGEYDANALWAEQAGNRVSSTGASAPAGSLFFWYVGNHGHVALVVRPGYVVSNDILRVGRLDEVRLSQITSDWSAVPRGWSLPFFPDAGAPVGPLQRIKKPGITVSLSAVQKAYGAAKKGHVGAASTHRDVLDVTRALDREGYTKGNPNNAIVGPGKLGQYKDWQEFYCRHHGIPVNSTSCDGVPGESSLKALGEHQDFAVTA